MLNLFAVYFERGFEGSIITVDWGRLATPNKNKEPITTLSYPITVRNVKIVGRRISDFISLLHYHNVIGLNQLHLIGFSLGAHIAGWNSTFFIRIAISEYFTEIFHNYLLNFIFCLVLMSVVLFSIVFWILCFQDLRGMIYSINIKRKCQESLVSSKLK